MTERELAYLRVAKHMHETAARLAPPLGAPVPAWDELGPATQELSVAVVAALAGDGTITIPVDPGDALEATEAYVDDGADVAARAEVKVEQARRAAWHEDEHL